MAKIMLYFLIILLEDNRGIITQSHSSRGKRGNRGMRTRAGHSIVACSTLNSFDAIEYVTVIFPSWRFSRVHLRYTQLMLPKSSMDGILEQNGQQVNPSSRSPIALVFVTKHASSKSNRWVAWTILPNSTAKMPVYFDLKCVG